MSDPLQQIRERVAEVAPTRVLPFLAALENFRITQRDHRQRVRDSHAAMAKAAGMESVLKPQSDDDMGDIIVTGDISTSASTSQRGELGQFGPAVTAAIGAATLGAGMWLQSWLSQPAPQPTVTQPPAVTQPAPDDRLSTGLTVERGGALP